EKANSIPLLKLLLSVAFALTGASHSGAQPDPNWLDHDRARPLPAVITGATASSQEQAGKPPSDAIILFDGQNLSNWVAMDGSPTKWIIKDGVMECVRGSGYVRTLQCFGD